MSYHDFNTTNINVKNDFNAKGDGVTVDTAALQSTFNALSAAGGGTGYFPPGTYVINSVARTDAITSVSGAVFNDVSAASGDVGSYVIGVGINGPPLKILSVVPGVSFTTNQAPGGTPTSVFVISGCLVMPPGIKLKGANSFLTANAWSNFTATSQILDIGSGVGIICVGNTSNTNQQAPFGFEDISIRGQNTNMFGVYAGNMSWFVQMNRCDVSNHGIANLAIDANVNSHTFLDCAFMNAGTSGATGRTAGVLMHPYWSQSSASCVFDNCFFDRNYGFGITDGGGSGAFGVKLRDCQFNTTRASAFAGSGVSADLQTTTMGTASITGGWSESAATNDLITNGNVLVEGFTLNSAVNLGWLIQSGIATAIGCVFSSHIQHSLSITAGAGINWAGLDVVDSSFYVNSPASSVFAGVGSSTEIVQSNPASATSVVNSLSLAPNLTANQKVIEQLGVVASSNNLAQWAFLFSSLGSTSNALNFSFFGGSNVLSLKADLTATFGGAITVPKLNVTTGTNANAGTGTLSGGTVTISTTAVTASSLIFLTDTSNGANIGTLSVGTKTAGTSFVVNSSNALDASTFNWLIIN